LNSNSSIADALNGQLAVLKSSLEEEKSRVAQFREDKISLQNELDSVKSSAVTNSESMSQLNVLKEETETLKGKLNDLEQANEVLKTQLKV
jgi:chromosome segregation ATPase